MKLTLRKDPSHKGYYQDQDGNLYVFRFGGRPIRVDDYRDDKPREDVNVSEVNVEKDTVIDHRKKSSSKDNQEFINELEREIRHKERKISEDDMSSEKRKELQKSVDNLLDEKTSTSSRTKFDEDDSLSSMSKSEITQRIFSRYPDVSEEDEDYLNSLNHDDLVKEVKNRGWNLEDENKSSVIGEELKPLSTYLSEHGVDRYDLTDSQYKEYLKEYRRTGEIESLKKQSNKGNDLLEQYKVTQGVSDNWFTEEARKLGMTDEQIANAIYERKGAEAQGSSDDNIKRIIAGKEKDKWEKKLSDYEKMIADPKTGEWDRQFAKSELQGIKNKVEEYSQWEAEYIKRLNRDEEVFTVKYSDDEFVENFRAVGLDEAFQLQEQWTKYSDDVHIYDANGNEIMYDKNRKHYTSPTYEENKRKYQAQMYRHSLYGGNRDRASLISLVHNLGLNWNVDRFTTQQLFRMLEKELDKRAK